MRALFLLKLLWLTIVAFVAGGYLVASVSLNGLLSNDVKAADVIRDHYPFHLVSPAWVSGRDQMDVLVNWTAAEQKARLILFLTLWVLSVGFLVSQFLRRRTHTP